MKKHVFWLIALYVYIVVFSVAYTVFITSGMSKEVLLENPWRLLQLTFSLICLSASLLLLLLVFWWFIDNQKQRQLQKDLQVILDSQPFIPRDDTLVSRLLVQLSKKMNRLTVGLQKTENSYITSSQEIVKQERKRIARDLHDTVSQGMFASSMILSGLATNVSTLTAEELEGQLKTVEDIINDAQNDLRILLLHLRPIELEDKSLSQGLAVLLKELTDKSHIQVDYQEDIGSLPTLIEANLFRIAQEFISNTLKHAKATRLEVYLYQSDGEVIFKMLDNGQGFDQEAVRDLSYGLKNIEDRVDDMAGSLTFLTSPGKGVSMTIRLPLIEEE